MSTTDDRRERVTKHDSMTGIDFIEVVRSEPPVLRVHFLNENTGFGVTPEAISVQSLRPQANPRSVPVEDAHWDGDVLEVTVAMRGDFTSYALAIDADRVHDIDRWFSQEEFSFQAVCERDLDCATAPTESTDEDLVDFPVDYMARDFASFRRALLEFAAQRYPDWGDPSAADQVVMLAEAMSAMGDEFAFYQDQIAREGYLETATQRRSVRRLTRLVDYEVRPATAATTWVALQVDPGAESQVPAGALLRGRTHAGATAPFGPDDVVGFEIGRRFEDVVDATSYRITSERNADNLQPYVWNTSAPVVERGATELSIAGDQIAALGLSGSGAADAQPARWLLLCDQPDDASEVEFCWPVRVVDARLETDRLNGDAKTTYIRWEDAQALPRAMDVDDLKVHANVLPALAGTTFRAYFIIGESPQPDKLPSAVERLGPDGSIIYRFTLPGSWARPLVWSDDEGCLCPHVELRSVYMPELEDADVVTDGDVDFDAARRWKPRRSFVSGPAARAHSEAFVLEPGSYRRIDAHFEDGVEHVHVDYAADAGYTIRFGDGELGRIPPRGTVFEVVYRLGAGSDSNIAAHTLEELAPPGATPFGAWPDTRPFALADAPIQPIEATGGANEEPMATTRRDAPQAFRHDPLRAVRPEDYADAAERLDWVQRAGAEFRWTGSWTTAFVTPDPAASTEVTPAQRAQLASHLDAVRQAGRPVEVGEPIYADIDLRLQVCVEPMALRDRVRRGVERALFGGAEGVGFFDPSRFSFGQPLERSALEAWVQRVDGVRAVEQIHIRRRGWFDWQAFDALRLSVADNEILRVENDPLFPGRGTAHIEFEGGR